MDRERAELHLRRLAETELREAVGGHARPPYRLAALTGRDGHGAARLVRAAEALVAIGAVEPETAGAILQDLQLALTVRRGDAPRTGELARSPYLRRGMHVAATVRSGPATVPPGPAAPGLAPHRVAPAGVMLPIRVDRGSGEMYLLAYAHTVAGARFTMTGWYRGTLEPGDLMDQVTFTDSKGTPYRAVHIGGIGIGEYAGQLRVTPEPPVDIDWLDVTAGDVTRRVSLNPPEQAVEVTPRQYSAGEQYLHHIGATLLASVPAFRGERPPHRALLASGASGLGAVIEALQAAGALPLLHPLRGQLVTLCESLGHTGHDIAAPAARDLPEQWVSLLSYHLRRKLAAAQPASGAADVAIAFPPVDGVAISILGLHNTSDSTVLHASAVLPAGHRSSRPRGFSSHDPLGSMHELPLLWLRDDGGRWHTIRRQVTSYNHDDHELILQLEIVPPLPRTATLEIVVGGATAQASATLPMRWR